MKEEIRVVKLPPESSREVDDAFELEIKSKNASLEYQASRTALVEFAEEQMQDGETKIRLFGSRGSALVTRTESIGLDSASPAFPDVKDAVAAGKLAGIVSVRKSYTVPEDKAERVLAVLAEAGLDDAVVVQTGYSIDQDAYQNRRDVKDASGNDAFELLGGVLIRKVIDKVTFRALK